MWRWAVPALLAAMLAGCETLTGGSFARAELENLNGSQVWGKVLFHQTDGKTLVGSMFDRSAPVAQSMAADAGTVFVRFDIKNLPSNRQFAFALHERGDCSADGTAIGDYFDPGGQGRMSSGSKTAQSTVFPILSSDGEGNLVLSFSTVEFTVAAGPRSIIHRSIVVREKLSDFLSRPGAKEGALIACGVIKATDI